MVVELGTITESDARLSNRTAAPGRKLLPVRAISVPTVPSAGASALMVGGPPPLGPEESPPQAAMSARQTAPTTLPRPARIEASMALSCLGIALRTQSPVQRAEAGVRQAVDHGSLAGRPQRFAAGGLQAMSGSSGILRKEPTRGRECQDR